MKCFKHDNEAAGVCAYCGRGVCAKCLEPAADKSVGNIGASVIPARLVCSAECASALAQESGAILQLLKQSFLNARASAFYCYLCSGLSAAGAVVAYFMLPSPFLIIFTAGCAVALLVSGFWYGRSVRKSSV